MRQSICPLIFLAYLNTVFASQVTAVKPITWGRKSVTVSHSASSCSHFISRIITSCPDKAPAMTSRLKGSPLNICLMDVTPYASSGMLFPELGGLTRRMFMMR